ncbi:MAG: methylated-DNA--[protein]-cysteine S-methyltransferase [Anaerolineae bacterium]|nr:methylated-DNA--[protein]-cysteine S-methyltransferase [Anaerolineae bacterium]
MKPEVAPTDRAQPSKVVETYLGYYESPIGLIEICATRDAITSVHFVAAQQYGIAGNGHIRHALKQIRAYFARHRQTFDLPLALEGTPFQERVWQAIASIPYGQTLSYAELARAVENPRALRAVGAAAGRNPIAIIVPCHRVVGSHGEMVGYGGGLWRKEWLLRHEGALLA